MKKYFSFQRGFTLAGFLIVIVVIGILAAGIISIVNPVASFQKAQDARRKSDLSQMQKALERYYQDIGSYPPNFGQNDYRIKGLDGNTVNWGNPWLPYMGVLPADPSSSKKYVYVSTGQAYFIYASLDREATSLSNFPSGASCGSGVRCNYGVSSPNVSP